MTFLQFRNTNNYLNEQFLQILEIYRVTKRFVKNTLDEMNNLAVLKEPGVFLGGLLFAASPLTIVNRVQLKTRFLRIKFV